MTQLDKSMGTQCIGRNLVDLPKKFNLVNPDLTLYYGADESANKLEVRVVNYVTTPELFKKSLIKYTEDAGSDRLMGSGKSTLINSYEKDISNDDNKVFLINYYDNPYGIGIAHQLHLLVDRAHILVKASSYENVKGYDGDLSPAVEARMVKLANEIRPVSEPVSAGPGFCLGPIVVDSDNDFENADMTFEMTRHPDVTVNIWMDNQSNAPDALHERMSAFGSMADGKHLTILRSNKLTLAGVPAQEQLAKIVEDGRTEFHFVIESRPEEPSLRQEGINMRLTTGGQLPNGRYVDSSLTEGEALALWDGIVKSFKPRPGAVRGAPADK